MNFFRVFYRVGANCLRHLTFRNYSAASLHARRIERLRKKLIHPLQNNFRQPHEQKFRPTPGVAEAASAPLVPKRPVHGPLPLNVPGNSVNRETPIGPTAVVPAAITPHYFANLLLRDPGELQRVEQKLRAGSRFHIGSGRREDPLDQKVVITVWHVQGHFWTNRNGVFYREVSLRGLLKDLGF